MDSSAPVDDRHAAAVADAAAAAGVGQSRQHGHGRRRRQRPPELELRLAGGSVAEEEIGGLERHRRRKKKACRTGGRVGKDHAQNTSHRYMHP